MTAKNVTNNHTSRLGIGAHQIAPGATVRVENWEMFDSSEAIKAWVAGGFLSIANAKDAVPFPPAAGGGDGAGTTKPKAVFPGGKDLTNDPDGAAKDVLIARLKELTGVEKTRASGLESLQRQVQDAEEKAKG